MGVFLAQIFERMRRKIDQNQEPVRPQNACRFGDRRGGPVGVMQHLMDHRGIERSVGQGS